MSNVDEKFAAAVEKIKECFLVSQGMAKSSFKTGERNDKLQAENKRLKKGLEIAKGIIRTPFKRHDIKTSLEKIDQVLKGEQ